jgi:hypothetical protein
MITIIPRRNSYIQVNTVHKATMSPEDVYLRP